MRNEEKSCRVTNEIDASDICERGHHAQFYDEMTYVAWPEMTDTY